MGAWQSLFSVYSELLRRVGGWEGGVPRGEGTLGERGVLSVPGDVVAAEAEVGVLGVEVVCES